MLKSLVAERPKIGKWVLSPHATTRMIERHITTTELDHILHLPDWVIPQGPKWILAKHFKAREDNLIAAVVLQKGGAELWIVLTILVHFERKM